MNEAEEKTRYAGQVAETGREFLDADVADYADFEGDMMFLDRPKK